MRKKGFNKSKQLEMLNFSKIPKGFYLYNNSDTFASPIYTIPLAGNIVVYTPIQGTNNEKYFIHIIYEGKMPTLAGN